MKNLLIVVSILLLIIVPVKAQELTKPSEIYIIQNNIQTKLKSNTISIQKNEFILKFILDKYPDLFINISENNYIYNAALNKIDQVYLFPFFGGKEFAEDNFNKDKHIILTDDSNHHWFFLDTSNYRFDAVKYENYKFICNRTIENYYDSTSKKHIPISDLKSNILYITIMRYNNKKIIIKKIDFNKILNNSKDKFYNFAKWALQKEYIDSSIYEDNFFEEIERVCFKINFIN